jgi:AraC-like DNA-binding protein
MTMQDRLQYNILYSCTGEAKRGHEPFVQEHALAYIISGEMRLHTDRGVMVGAKGTLGLIRRNQLVKAVKTPAADGPFMAINVLLDQRSLREYSASHGVQATGIYTGEQLVELPLDPFLKGYFDSLWPYFENPGQLTEILARTKTTEVITLLLRDPSLKNLLFDFNEPYKIDLEAYMNRNFMYNVPLSQLAHLTGRSLSTFKRDFVKIFNMPPERWLLKKRLQQAHYLITQKNQRPSEIYIDVGFENLSHFSDAFKKHFGYPPRELSSRRAD